MGKVKKTGAVTVVRKHAARERSDAPSGAPDVTPGRPGGRSAEPKKAPKKAPKSGATKRGSTGPSTKRPATPATPATSARPAKRGRKEVRGTKSGPSKGRTTSGNRRARPGGAPKPKARSKRSMAPPRKAGPSRGATRGRAKKKARPQRPVHVPVISYRVKPLDPLQKCGAGTSVQSLYRVDETVDGSLRFHLVFNDRHGWYCEHGRNCPAVSHARKFDATVRPGLN